MAAYGLYTHIASNKLRSMLLLAGLFLLIYVLVFAGALVAEVFMHGGRSAGFYLTQARRDLIAAFPYATIAAGLWVVIAYFFHQNMIDAVTGGESVTRQQEPRLVLPRHVMAAGHRIDDLLVEEIGDHDPGGSADGGKRKCLDQIAAGEGDVSFERPIAVESHFRQQRAGEYHYVDEQEQAAEQQHRANLVRCNVRVKTIRGHDALPVLARRVRD